MFGESKREKQLRLELQDLCNKVNEQEAKQNGLPFFSIRYEDDDRIKGE